VRLIDVATLAGVTTSTASRALGRPEMVRPETRARVEAAARELGYEPNRVARSLITGRTSTIAIVVPDLTNTYFGLICRAVQILARERGYEVLILDTDRDPAQEREIVESVARWADGVIICSAQSNHRSTPNGVPIVYVNRRARGSHAVILDQEWIVETQVQHLVQLGHERILYLEGPDDYWASEVRRRRVETLTLDRDIRFASGYACDFEGGMRAAAELPPDVTAVIAFNDVQAFGLVNHTLQRGIRVPEDLSVIGSDDVPGSKHINPGLTTVHAPKEAMGRAAVSLLIDHLTHEGPMIVETLQGHLVVRQSTAPPRAVRAPRAAAPRAGATS
jgi:DNA-binding LacI/PurR family transcriptional regulator